MRGYMGGWFKVTSTAIGGILAYILIDELLVQFQDIFTELGMMPSSYEILQTLLPFFIAFLVINGMFYALGDHTHKQENPSINNSTR